jgi:hypothetical protein
LETDERDTSAAIECRALADRMAELLIRGMGRHTRWALTCALGAAEMDGVVGELRLMIPANSKAFIEAEYQTYVYQPVEVASTLPRKRAR